MATIDLNLLIALDALLTERSVTAAARRLALSVSAMSRTLARLRKVTGDPLLLQAGRTLVLTPYAEQLSVRLPALTREAMAILSPPDHQFDAAKLTQCFNVRAGEGFIDILASSLLARINQTAPGATIRFVPKQNWDAQPLRDGLIDLEIGTVRTSAPELRTRQLFRDRYVAVCRHGHPVLALAQIDAKTFAAFGHVLASRTGEDNHPVDTALLALDLQRNVRMVVPAYTHAMQIAGHSDLLAVIPASCMGNTITPGHATSAALRAFELPVALPSFSVSSIWHPRLDKDPANSWFRNEVLLTCQAAFPALIERG
jgi:DNA-binding transcriptional LysR family regulator